MHSENLFAVFNESLCACVLYCYMMATDFNEILETKDLSGYGILLMIFLCISVNLVKFFIQVINEIRQKLPLAWAKWRLK